MHGVCRAFYHGCRCLHGRSSYRFVLALCREKLCLACDFGRMTKLSVQAPACHLNSLKSGMRHLSIYKATTLMRR